VHCVAKEVWVMTLAGNPKPSRSSRLCKFCLLTIPVWLCALAAAQAPTFVSFDAPDAGLAEGLGTHPARINRNGVIAGWYLDSHVLMHGFVRTANGQITEFDAAGAKGTHPDDINSFGQIVGETSSAGVRPICRYLSSRRAVPHIPQASSFSFSLLSAVNPTGVKIFRPECSQKF
jgi:hypothetical protein